MFSGQCYFIKRAHIQIAVLKKFLFKLEFHVQFHNILQAN